MNTLKNVNVLHIMKFMSKLKKLIMMAQDNGDESYMCIEALEDGLQVSLTTRCEYSSDGLFW